MRLFACACSAVLLSGCSWLGIGGGGHGYQSQYEGTGGRYGVQTNQYAQQYRSPASVGHCQITSPNQRVPQGCRPEQVTLAIGGGHSNYQAQPQYTTGGYGSHVGVAQSRGTAYQVEKRTRRPLLRGQLSIGFDRSISGDIYDPSVNGSAASYNRALFVEGGTTGSVASGQVVTTTYTSSPERLDAPNISIADAYNSPVEVKGGLELILSDHATVFANAGYTRANGKTGGGAQVIDTLLKTVTQSDYITDPAQGVVGTLIGTTSNTEFIPNEVVATYDYAFNDLKKYDIEAGARYYFNPILKGKVERPLTPFVGVSGGAAHYNETTINENQRQRFIQRAFDNNQTNPDGDFYDVNFGARTQIYDAQWVPYGAVKAGLEWQMTPRTALAFETGVKYEGSRDFSNGNKGDDHVSIPLTIRGSYNF